MNGEIVKISGGVFFVINIRHEARVMDKACRKRKNRCLPGGLHSYTYILIEFIG